jgi:hypothetical protein
MVKYKRGRPAGWQDNIKMDINRMDVDWIQLARDRQEWRAVTKVEMNFGCQKKKMLGISWFAQQLSGSRHKVLPAVKTPRKPPWPNITYNSNIYLGSNKENHERLGQDCRNHHDSNSWPFEYLSQSSALFDTFCVRFLEWNKAPYRQPALQHFPWPPVWNIAAPCRKATCYTSLYIV